MHVAGHLTSGRRSLERALCVILSVTMKAVFWLLTFSPTSCTGVFPCAGDSVGKGLGISVTAIINPAIQMETLVFGLEWSKDGLQEGLGKQRGLRAARCHALGDMEPVAEFGISQHCFWSCVDLHGHAWRVSCCSPGAGVAPKRHVGL